MYVYVYVYIYVHLADVDELWEERRPGVPCTLYPVPTSLTWTSCGRSAGRVPPEGTYAEVSHWRRRAMVAGLCTCSVFGARCSGFRVQGSGSRVRRSVVSEAEVVGESEASHIINPLN